MADSANDAFYVGYLPAPARHRRFLVVLVPALLLLIVLAAILIAAGQRDPGSGLWETNVTSAIAGVVHSEPYAMLRTTVVHDPGYADYAGGPFRTVMLVSEGKFGAVELVKPFDAKPVVVLGTVLRRGGQKLMEIQSMRPTTSLSEELVEYLQRRDGKPLGSVTLRGEIIDPKCYSGAMKPGSGKTHKACGTLCIMGGIPPMFVTRDEQLRDTFYLLTDANGGPIREPILPFIGDDVEVTGQLERQEDLLVLRLGECAISRTHR